MPQPPNCLLKRFVFQKEGGIRTISFLASATLMLVASGTAWAETQQLAIEVMGKRIATPEAAAPSTTSGMKNAINPGALVPYEQAERELRQRPIPETVDIEALLSKTRPKPVPDLVSSGSRGKSIQALKQRLSAANGSNPPKPLSPGGEESLEAIKARAEARPAVDPADYYPEPKATSIGLSSAQAKNGLTGTMAPYDQLKKLSKQRRPPAPKGPTAVKPSAESGGAK